MATDQKIGPHVVSMRLIAWRREAAPWARLTSLHEVAVAVELGDAGHALRVGSAVDTSTLPSERRARLHIDMARAHTQRRQVGEAVAALLEAESITPEQVRNHRITRPVVSDLLTIQDPPSSDLRELAERVGA